MPRASTSSSGSAEAELIRNRIAAVLSMRRLRRQRVQIPLFVASAALFVLGAVLIFVSTLAHAPFQLRCAARARMTHGQQQA